MAQALKVEIQVDQKELTKLGNSARRGVELAAVGMTERLLDRIEETTFITKYTQNANPVKPSGSIYIRKFKLQASSSKAITKRSLPVTGTWQAKAAYSSFVIGTSAQQAAIHRGRWPILEFALAQVDNSAQRIFDDEFSKVAK